MVEQIPNLKFTFNENLYTNHLYYVYIKFLSAKTNKHRDNTSIIVAALNASNDR